MISQLYAAQSQTAPAAAKAAAPKKAAAPARTEIPLTPELKSSMTDKLAGHSFQGNVKVDSLLVKGTLPDLKVGFSKDSNGALQYQPHREKGAGSLESFKPEGLSSLLPSRLTQGILKTAGGLERQKFGENFPQRNVDIQKAYKNPDGSVDFAGKIHVPDKNGKVSDVDFKNMRLAPDGTLSLHIDTPVGLSNDYRLKMLDGN